jgi:hypothetical protein
VPYLEIEERLIRVIRKEIIAGGEREKGTVKKVI